MLRHLAVSLLILGIASSGIAGDWPQWRGPNRTAVLEKSPAWPNKIDDKTLTTAWQIPDLGPSYSGPIVADGMVFTTESVDKKYERALAYDLKTGRKLWETQWDGAMTVPFFAKRNGDWIRATPAYDQGKLYVAGMRDLLVCLDAKTGKTLWTKDFIKDFQTPLPSFGFVSSPLVVDKAVYVQAGASVVKLNTEDGKVLWRSLKDDGGMNGSAFACPTLAKIGSSEQLVVLTRTKMAGLDPKTGSDLWTRTIPAFRGMNILTPVVSGNRIFTSTYGGTTQAFTVTPKAGQVTSDQDTKFDIKDDWSLKYEGYMCTPVVVNGYAYFLGKDRRAICVNIESGKEAWRSEQRFGEYWSLVANGDKILALDSRGILYLLKANTKELEILEERKVATAETWAHLAVTDDHVIIRDLAGLTCFQWKR